MATLRGKFQQYQAVNPNPNPKPTIHVDLIEYIDLLYHLMGVDITYRDWHEMSDSDKLSFARDLKIKKIIE